MSDIGMVGDRFRVPASILEAFNQHAPEASTRSIRVDGEVWWRVGTGADDDGEAFVDYARLPAPE